MSAGRLAKKPMSAKPFFYVRQSPFDVHQEKRLSGHRSLMQPCVISMYIIPKHETLLSTCGFESHQGPFGSLTFPPVLRDWVIKGFGMSSLVYATGHIKDPVPLVEKSRGLSPGGRFPPSFIHQVIIITGLNKLQLYVLALKMALDADRA